jgi:hypothetical protein
MSDNSQIIAMIATLEQNLSQLKAALNGEAIIPAKAKRTKKEKDPNAAPKEPNVWIKFTQRVGTLLKAAAAEDGADAEHFKGPATMVKEFCSMLKGQKPYDAWADSEVLEAFESWERPVHEPRTKKSPAGSASIPPAHRPVGKIRPSSSSTALFFTLST